MADGQHKYLKDESARRVARVVLVVISLVGLGLAYWAWPDGMMEAPLSEASGHKLFWAAASVLIALFTASVVWRAWRDI